MPLTRNEMIALTAGIAVGAFAGANVDKGPFAAGVEDFYLTIPSARTSAIMGECSALAEARTTMTAAE